MADTIIKLEMRIKGHHRLPPPSKNELKLIILNMELMHNSNPALGVRRIYLKEINDETTGS